MQLTRILNNSKPHELSADIFARTSASSAQRSSAASSAASRLALRVRSGGSSTPTYSSDTSFHLGTRRTFYGKAARVEQEDGDAEDDSRDSAARPSSFKSARTAYQRHKRMARARGATHSDEDSGGSSSSLQPPRRGVAGLKRRFTPPARLDAPEESKRPSDGNMKRVQRAVVGESVSLFVSFLFVLSLF